MSNITLTKLHKNYPYLDEMKTYYQEYEKADEEQRDKIDNAGCEYLPWTAYVVEIFNQVSKVNNIQVLDPAPYFCNEVRCIAQIDGRPLYRDSNHLSEFGNKLLKPMFGAVLE